jgi:hypothetical protein
LFVTAASHSAHAPFRPRREPSAAELQALAERLGLHEVGEGPLAVDLDDGDRGTVGRFQLGAAADVDVLEVAGAYLLDDLERPLAEVASLRAVDDDSRDRDLA